MTGRLLTLTKIREFRRYVSEPSYRIFAAARAMERRAASMLVMAERLRAMGDLRLAAELDASSTPKTTGPGPRRKKK